MHLPLPHLTAKLYGLAPVPAHLLDLGMLSYPGGQGFHFPIGQEIEGLPRIQIDEERGVLLALAEREVIHPQMHYMGRARAARRWWKVAERGIRADAEADDAGCLRSLHPAPTTDHRSGTRMGTRR